MKLVSYLKKNSIWPMDKSNVISLILAFMYWILTFFTDRKIFSNEPLDMSVFPIDLAASGVMHILTKIVLLIFLVFLFIFLNHARTRRRLAISFIVLSGIYVMGLILTYPGYYMNDDAIIFAYATRFYPVYWHNYLTSLFYMVGMSMFPASSGPILLSDLIYAMVYAYLFDRGVTILENGKMKRALNLFILAGVMPFVLLGALMCFRPAVYSSFFVFYFGYLFFEYKQQAVINGSKLCVLSLLTALLAFWRSESIVLLPLGIILIAHVYYPKRIMTKKCLFSILMFLLTVVILMTIIKIPQKRGEKEYYGSDYLIISTIRPLSVILHRPQNYEGAFEDVQNIDAVIDVDYILNDTLSCSAYNRYNSDHNEGKFTQTMASPKKQKDYVRSACRLILHNMDLYLGERLQLFLVTNGIFNYNPQIVGGLSMTFNGGYPLFERDRDYSFGMLKQYKRLSIGQSDRYVMGLFRFGGEAYLPMLALTIVAFFISFIRRKWFLFWGFGALLAREAAIFFMAPASFIQYSYPMMYVTALWVLFILLDFLSKSVENSLN